MWFTRVFFCCNLVLTLFKRTKKQQRKGAKNEAHLVESACEVRSAAPVGNGAVGWVGLEELLLCLEGMGDSLVLLDVLLTSVHHWDVTQLQGVRATIQDVQC